MTAAATAGIGPFAPQRKGAVGEGFFGDEVDHPADRIRAVQRRCAVAQHFNPVNGGEWNGVQVHSRAVDGVVAQATAVEQYQGLVGADAAHVGKAGPAGSGPHRTGGVLYRLVAGHPLHQLGGRGHAFVAQLLGAQNGDRHRGFGIDPANRRTGHLHALQLGGGGCSGGVSAHRCAAHRSGCIVRRCGLRSMHLTGAHPQRNQIQRHKTMSLQAGNERLEGKT